MKNKQKKTIFIIGYARSGTTLLNKALSAHPDIYFINYEFNDLPFFYFNQNLYKKYGNKKYQIMTKDFFNHPIVSGSASSEAINCMYATNFKNFIERAFDHLRKKQNKNIIGIKASNNIIDNITMVKAIFREAYCIHLIRDPRDVFLSLKNTSFGPASPFYAAKSWSKTVEAIKSLKNNLDHYCELQYERLVINPGEELGKLCSFLEIKFSKEMLNYEDHLKKVPTYQYHSLLNRGFISCNYNKWKKQLSKKELNLIYTGAEETMYESGYTQKKYKKDIKFIHRLGQLALDKTYHYFRLLRALLLWNNPYNSLKNKKYLTKIYLKRKVKIFN